MKNRLAYIPSSRRSARKPHSSHQSHSPYSSRRGGLADSFTLSNQRDYRAVIVIEKRRALCLAISIVSLLIAAACIYFAQA